METNIQNIKNEMEEPIDESPPSQPPTPTTSLRTPKNSRKPALKRGLSNFSKNTPIGQNQMIN